MGSSFSTSQEKNTKQELKQSLLQSKSYEQDII